MGRATRSPFSPSFVGKYSDGQPHGAEEDEALVFREHRLVVGALGVDPEFEHAARTMKRAGDAALALDLAWITQIDDNRVGQIRSALRKLLDGFSRRDRLDRRIGFIEHRLVATNDGLGHIRRSVSECQRSCVLWLSTILSEERYLLFRIVL